MKCCICESSCLLSQFQDTFLVNSRTHFYLISKTCKLHKCGLKLAGAADSASKDHGGFLIDG